jgi:RimJ/RimL family protein N-acetyltransferase
VKLVPISEHPDAAKILWDLMEEVSSDQAISHKGMPTWEDHLDFVHRAEQGLTERNGVLYDGFYLIEVGDRIVGYVSLTSLHWIGIRLFRSEQGEGYGPQAVKLLIERHGHRRYVANINPMNSPSRKMFSSLGFKPVQVTYALEAE